MCYRPMLGVEFGGKVQLIKWAKREYYEKLHLNIVQLPCGKCEECIKQKKWDLAKRIKKELSFWKQNSFITLTYTNENLKPLNKRDIQLFIKRFRKKYPEKGRNFYVGELGGETKRPHYHMILFNYFPEDAILDNAPSKKGFKQYKSKELQQIWGLGIVKICKMEKGLINYILKDMTKNMGKTTDKFLIGYSKIPPLGLKKDISKEELKKELLTKNHLPHCYKDYYQRHFEKIELPEEKIEDNKLTKEQFINEIEKQTKQNLIDYIDKRRTL